MPRRLLVTIVVAGVVIAAATLAYMSSGEAPAPPPTTGDHAYHAVPEAGTVTIAADRQRTLGLRSVRVERRHGAVEVRAAGVIAFDQTRETEVSARVDGWVRDLRANHTGLSVRAGERLFTLYSPELLATENEYLLALVALQQHGQNPTLPETRDHALRLAQAARDRLALWNVTPAEIAALEQRNKALGTAAVVAPRAGVVVEKNVVEGMRIAAGQRLFLMADLSSVWLEASVPEREIRFIQRGQAAAVQLDAYPGEMFHGRTVSISPALTPETRTVGVRLELSNAGGRLRQGMYGTAVISADETMALVVPRDAVAENGRDRVVFVAGEHGAFTPRTVTTGRQFGEMVEVVSGLAEGEEVAAGATFLLNSASRRQVTRGR